MTATILRAALGVTAAAAACLSAAGCQASAGAPGHSTGASARPASAPDPLASLTGKQIAAKALDDLKSAPSLTLAGTVTDKGQPETVSFGIARGGCVNTVSMGSKGTVTMIMIGKSIWMKADAAFWKASGGGDAGMVGMFAGKYVKMPTGGGGAASDAETCSIGELTSSSNVPLSGDVTKGTLTTVNGQRVYPLTHKDTTEDDTMYVTDTSTPRIIEVVGQDVGKGNTDSGRFTVSYGVPQSVTTPPASQTTAFPTIP